MQIRDLSAPVTASKADWLGGTTWLGFTPTDGGLNARNRCQSTIQRQFGSGYVIEYITEQFSKPNPGFEKDPEYIAEREKHRNSAGRFVAVHKLRTTARSLETILGPEEFKQLQDMWAQSEKRYCWSVAFPIVESYEITSRPKAKDILGEDRYQVVYQHPSSVLRILNDSDRKLISELDLRQITTSNSWIGIDDEFKLAEASEINPKVEREIQQDLVALEGMTEERLAKVKRRAAWIADRFIRERQKAGTLLCDDCAFDPSKLAEEIRVKARGFLDVHHKHPLDEGGSVYHKIGLCSALSDLSPYRTCAA